jgi:hypothetical protein
MSSPTSSPSTTSTSEDLTSTVADINKHGSDLDAAAAKVVDEIGLPSLKQALAEQPELRALDPLRAVDLISSLLAEYLFAVPDGDVLVETGDDQYIAIPAEQRDVFRSAITRVLAKRTEDIGALLKAKS